MENLKEIKISESLYRDIRAYCQLNNLNVEKFVEGLIKKNFMEEKYGTKPNIHRKPKSTSTPEKVEVLTTENLEKTVIVKTEKHPEITVTAQKEVKEEPKKVVEEEKPVKQEEETPKVKKRILS